MPNHDDHMKPVKSSNIEAVGYKDGVLSVRFRSGGTWDYHGVSPDQHRAFIGADSVGSHFHKNICGKFTEKKRDK